MSQRGRVGLPATIAQLRVDQRAGVGLVEIEVLGSRLGAGGEIGDLRPRCLGSLGLERGEAGGDLSLGRLTFLGQLLPQRPLSCLSR